MRTSRIYTAQALEIDQSITLDTAKSHYLLKVLRHQHGQSVILFNGDGHDYIAHISNADRKQTVLEITAKSGKEPFPTLHIHLGMALSKGDRFDIALQKATELGVSRITPLITEYNTFKLPAERLQKKIQHWSGITEAACEQSGRCYPVQLDSPMKLADWQEMESAALKLTLHPGATRHLQDFSACDKLVLLVGPEGGLSEMDLQIANNKGFQSVTLGRHILRTETAPLAAIAATQMLWGDFR